MPRSDLGIFSFNGGLLSPQIGGRIDADKYSSGAQILCNLFPLVEGPLIKRSGLRFVKEVKDSADGARLLGFQFNVEQAYILEYGDTYFRIYRDGSGVVDSSQAIVGSPTAANPVNIEVTGHGYTTADEVFVSGSGMAELNSRYFTITVVDPNNFTLDGEDGTGRTTGTGGTVAKTIEVVTPYAVADVFTIKKAQSADVLYTVQPSYAPQKVSRTSDTAWTNVEVPFAWPAFEPDSVSGVTIAASATTGSGITLTASSAIFVATDVGRYIRLTGTGGLAYPTDESGSEGYAIVTAVGSPPSTTCTADVVVNFENTSATSRWARDAWNPVNGYPSCVTFFEDSTWWSGVPGLPQYIWKSRTGDYENMARAQAATGGLLFPLNSTTINPVEWLEGQDALLVGTRGSEWTLTSINQDSAISAGNVRARRRGQYGSRQGVQPAAVDNVVLFVQRAGRKVREFVYQFVQDRFTAVNLNRLSREVTDGIVRCMAFQQEPNRLLWVGNEDSTAASLTYEREDEVAAWSEMFPGGSPLAGATHPGIQSLDVIPTDDETSDQLWVVVERTINGGTKRYVEYLLPFWERTFDTADEVFVDSAITYNGSPASSFVGLNHLEGETLQVLADGAVHPDVTVSGGAVTLNDDYSIVHFGLQYVGDYLSMRLETGNPLGTAQGKVKRHSKLVIRVDQTGPGLSYGPNFENLQEVNFREVSDLMDTPVPLTDGDTQALAFPSGWSRDGTIALRHNLPLPCTIVGLFPESQTHGS